MKKDLYIVLLTFFTLFIIACSSQQNETSEVETIMDTLEKEDFLAPEWTKDATIYEVNLRQYSDDSSIDALTNDLPRLKEMGVDILWLMPVHPIGKKNRKGPLGSYYAVADYKAINPEYGTIEDFMELVEITHQNGMKIIIDWVANHTAFDHHWVQEHIEWYTADSAGNRPTAPIGTDWTDVADLNFDEPEMRTEMINTMKYWVDSINIDGFRCDAVGLDWMPVDFWEQVKTEMDKLDKPIYLLGEGGDEQLENAFHSLYGWHIHHTMNSIAKGEKHPLALDTAVNEMIEKFGYETTLLQFTSNHDENSWAGTVFERMGDAAKTFATVSFTIPGIPLIYSGQEAPMKKRLKFFEHDPIEWNNYEYSQFYKKLNALKDENPALWSGTYGGEYQKLTTSNDNVVFAFKREKDNNCVICVYNITNRDANVTIDIKDELVTTEYFSGVETVLNNNTKIGLAPWEYMIFIAK